MKTTLTPELEKRLKTTIKEYEHILYKDYNRSTSEQIETYKKEATYQIERLNKAIAQGFIDIA